ncbi:MAG TPA: TlpA disulfide reductase family protein, partial [Gemmatimonadales bacterium]
AGGARFRPLAVGDTVPAYAARTLAGDTARVGAGAEAPVTLVNVWATWCIPCQREFPELERLHRAHSGRGLRVLAVSVDRGGDEDVRRFVGEQGATFTIARDPDGRVQERFQAIGIPESYLVGADGRLLWRRVGELPAHDPALAAAIDGALDAATGGG